jgi:hypothetical protein
VQKKPHKSTEFWEVRGLFQYLFRREFELELQQARLKKNWVAGVVVLRQGAFSPEF